MGKLTIHVRLKSLHLCVCVISTHFPFFVKTVSTYPQPNSTDIVMNYEFSSCLFLKNMNVYFYEIIALWESGYKKKHFLYVFRYKIAYGVYEIFSNDFMRPWKEQRIVKRTGYGVKLRTVFQLCHLKLLKPRFLICKLWLKPYDFENKMTWTLWNIVLGTLIT